jgi:hypothetical protein
MTIMVAKAGRASRCWCRRRCTRGIIILIVALIAATHDSIAFVEGFPAAAFVSSSFRSTIAGTAGPTGDTSPQHRHSFAPSGPTINASTQRKRRNKFRLCAAKSAGLRPAAGPLMESGKQLAVAGERVIAWTDRAGLYGGGISAAGAQLRNAGDSVAQAAASCRFQTGQELVCDELRTAADCLGEATNKLRLGAEEAGVDEQYDLQKILEACVPLVQQTSEFLENAGAGIMQNQPIPDVARSLANAGKSLVEMSARVGQLGTVSTGTGGKTTNDDPDDDARTLADDAARRMLLAGEKMVEAARALVPRAASSDATKAVGKRWIKG